MSPTDVEEGNATILGTVYDTTQAVLVDASVILGDGRGGIEKTETNGSGAYVFEGVAPGVYTVTGAAEGFGPVTERIELSGSSTSTLDLTLDVLITAEVEVNRGVLEPRRNLSSFILTGPELAALPRDPRLLEQRLAALAGHVGRPGEVSFYVDGFARRFRLPPLSAIQMIRIDANSFDAEFQEAGEERGRNHHQARVPGVLWRDGRRFHGRGDQRTRPVYRRKTTSADTNRQQLPDRPADSRSRGVHGLRRPVGV